MSSAAVQEIREQVNSQLDGGVTIVGELNTTVFVYFRVKAIFESFLDVSTLWLRFWWCYMSFHYQIMD